MSSYTNPKCLQLKYELIQSTGDNMYTPNTIYTTKGQQWYINQKGYVHFIKGDNNMLLTNDFTFKY